VTTDLLTAYAIAAVVFFALDMVWLGLVANRFYRSEIGHLLAPKPDMAIAAGFYLLYLIGLMIFAIAPELAAGNWQRAAQFGALFGFFAYATYDLTNLSTMQDFSWKVALVDMAWGAALSGAVAATSIVATGLILGR
jgi:uncharacterized membrane protein